MFSIYNINGRSFRDTMEALHDKRTVISKSQSIAVPNRETPVSESSRSNYVSNNAINAYRTIRQLDKREPIYHAYQVMSENVASIWLGTDILTARNLFKEKGFQQMPVVSGSNAIVGLLTLDNLFQSISIDEKREVSIKGNNVSDVISKDVITADPVTDIRRIAQVMFEYSLTAVPIVNDSDKLIGIVSRSDILKAVMGDPPLNMWS